MKQVEAHIQQLFEQAHNHTGNDWTKELIEFRQIMSEVIGKVMPAPDGNKQHDQALEDIKNKAKELGLK